MIGLWDGTEIAAFLEQQWSDPDSRRMFTLGQIAVKVAGMFHLLGQDDVVPPEARKAAVCWLLGLESDDAAVYAEFNAEALRQYAQWVAAQSNGRPH